MKFTICIEENVIAEFEVEAKDAEEAMKIVEEKYYKGEFVLAPGEVSSRQMAIVKPESEACEWVEF